MSEKELSNVMPPDEATIDAISKWVYQDLLLSNAARRSRVHQDILDAWMEKGSDDAKEGINSNFSSLYFTVREMQAKRISETLAKISSCPRNWQSLAWFLEKCFREDFSNDAELYKNLLDDYRRIIQDITQIKDFPNADLKGIIIDGELDTESDKETRFTPKEP